MSCVICIAIYDTIENKRTEYTKEMYKSLMNTIDYETTRIIMVDNNSCKATKDFLSKIKEPNVKVITNKENIGTAEAINQGLKTRDTWEYAIKMDNDIVVKEYGWVEKMTKCFQNDVKLGILGLKRKDLPNAPDHEVYKTDLRFLSHNLGDKWNIIEECSDIIGSCTMFSPYLLNEVGYMYQPGLYGYDDVLMCERSILAGFYNAFYPSVEIEHLDDGKTQFTTWKQNHAGIYMGELNKIISEYREKSRPIYYNPF